MWNKINKNIIALITLFFSLPLFTFAQASFDSQVKTNVGAVSGFAGNLVRLVNTGIGTLLAVAVVVFIYAIIKYVVAAAPKEKAKARNIIVYGVIFISVALSILGLARFLLGFFGVGNGGGQITSSSGTGPLNTIVNSLLGVINSFIPLLIAVGLIIFMSGVIRFLWRADDVKVRQNGKDLMIWGVIAIACILGVWGLALGAKNIFFPNSATPLSSRSSSGNTGGTGKTDGVYLLSYRTADGQDHNEYLITLAQCSNQLGNISADYPDAVITAACIPQ